MRELISWRDICDELEWTGSPVGILMERSVAMVVGHQHFESRWRLSSTRSGQLCTSG